MFGACGVVVDNLLRLVARHLNQLSVACDVGNLKVEGQSALLRAFQVARSAQLEVGLGNSETIVGVAHYVDALARFLCQLGLCNQYAV